MSNRSWRAPRFASRFAPWRGSWRGLALIPLLLTLAACSALPLGKSERTIAVTGEGSVVVPPDTVVITLGVQTRGPEVGPAVAANNETAESVMKAVTDLGVSPDDVQTTYFTIWTQTGYDEFGNPTEVITYFVDNTVTVTLHDVSQLGKVLGDALAAGANSVQSLSYTVADPAAVLGPARSQALADAQAQAEQLASASGVTLGEILTIAESSGGQAPVPAPYEGQAVPSGSDVPTSAGTIEYLVQLAVTYGVR